MSPTRPDSCPLGINLKQRETCDSRILSNVSHPTGRINLARRVLAPVHAPAQLYDDNAVNETNKWRRATALTAVASNAKNCACELVGAISESSSKKLTPEKQYGKYSKGELRPNTKGERSGNYFMVKNK